MLDLPMLMAMPEHCVFATGLFKIPKRGLFVRWVAVRGDIHDWAIYFSHPSWELDRIWLEGEKVMTEEEIKKLVPCDDEAFSMYRH